MLAFDSVWKPAAVGLHVFQCKAAESTHVTQTEHYDFISEAGFIALRMQLCYTGVAITGKPGNSERKTEMQLLLQLGLTTEGSWVFFFFLMCHRK